MIRSLVNWVFSLLTWLLALFLGIPLLKWLLAFCLMLAFSDKENLTFPEKKNTVVEITKKESKNMPDKNAIASEEKKGTKLFWAIDHYPLEKVKELVDQKIGINARDVYQETPLTYAASLGRWDVAEILLKAGANPWAYERFYITVGVSAFWNKEDYFPTYGQLEAYKRVQKVLLKIGYPVAPTPAPDCGDYTIKQLVKEGKWPPKGALLTAKGIDGDALKLSDFTPEQQKIITYVRPDMDARKKNLSAHIREEQKKLKSEFHPYKDPARTNDRPYNYTGISPLLGAVENGDVEEVKRLAPLKKGLEDRDGKGGETALMFATTCGSWEMAEILLDNGANPWAYDIGGGGVGVIQADDEHSPTTQKDLEAYWRTREKLLKMGYPLHAPKPQEILKLVKEGKWPPAFVSEAFKRTARP